MAQPGQPSERAAPDLVPRALRGKPWAVALLVAVVAVTFANTLSNGFVWDDFDIIVDNPQTQDLGSLGKVLFSPDLTPPYYRPLTRASFVLEAGLFGVNATVAHAISGLFHLAAVILLFLWAKVLLRKELPALAVALLWGVHPVASEAVGLVSVRTNPMAAAFMFGSLLLFWQGLERGDRQRLWASGLAFLAAMGCKEQAVMVLPLAALTWTLAPGLGGPPFDRKKATQMLAPLGVALGVYLAARIYALGGLMGEVPPVVGRTASMGLHEMVVATGKYTGLFVWPMHLTVTHELRSGPTGLFVFGFFAVAALTWFSVRHPTPARVFGIAWFWLTLLPTLQIVALPSAPFAERHAYFMYAGLLLVVVDWAATVLAQRASRRALVAAAVGTAALACALAVRTVVRNRDWRDNRTLFESALAVAPSAMAHLNLGNAALKDGDLATAAEHWQAAIALDPRDGDALNQLGVLYAQAGRFEQAREYFVRALDAFPGHPVARDNLARLPAEARPPRPGRKPR